jgi:hypothetical protein
VPEAFGEFRAFACIAPLLMAILSGLVLVVVHVLMAVLCAADRIF